MTVLQQEREFHSLPEERITSKPIEISRPHSDTDVTKLEHSKSLQIKGGGKIVIEEPQFESLSFSVSVYDEEKYYAYSTEDTNPVNAVSFYIPDHEDPATPLVEDVPSPLLMPTEATQPSMPSRKLGSSADLTYHLKNG